MDLQMNALTPAMPEDRLLPFGLLWFCASLKIFLIETLRLFSPISLCQGLKACSWAEGVGEWGWGEVGRGWGCCGGIYTSVEGEVWPKLLRLRPKGAAQKPDLTHTHSKQCQHHRAGAALFQ